MDLFELEKEKKVMKSGVRDVFTPYQPIQEKELFFGRSLQINSIIKQINTPGQHSILFGDRGVGKSSLANIAAKLLKTLTDDRLIVKRCDSEDSFATIVEPLLLEVGIDLQVASSQSQQVEGVDAGVKAFGLSAKAAKKDTQVTTLDGLRARASSPSWVAEQLSGLKALFLLDEIDVIDTSEKYKVAQLVKLLSDSGTNLKFLIVGIAETASQLTSGHESVQRCLKETQLKKMSDEEIENVINSGANKLGLNFSPSAIKKIVNISAGYAHFAHLLALKAAEAAIGEDRNDIQLGHINDSINDATGDAEGLLLTSYSEAIRSANTDEFKKVLVAAASIKQEEITAAELLSKYKALWNEDVEKNWLNRYIGKVVSNDSNNIMRRLGKGVYKFNDPRMPSFIRLSNFKLLSKLDD